MRSLITYDGRREPDRCMFPGDLRDGAVHFVAVENGIDIAVASITIDAETVCGVEVEWLLQFLAVSPQWRNRGVASSLIKARLDRVRSFDAQFAWCKARTYAAPLYEHLGAKRDNYVYDLHPIGPHVNMLYGPLS